MATEYITLKKMIAIVPQEYIAQAMDDDGEGGADAGVWDEIAEAVADEVEGPLGLRYSVPFDVPFPKIVRQAARIFCAEILYLRRGISGEDNPWSVRATSMRRKLNKIGSGDDPLGPDYDKETPSGSIISEPSKTYSNQGRLIL